MFAEGLMMFKRIVIFISMLLLSFQSLSAMNTPTMHLNQNKLNFSANGAMQPHCDQRSKVLAHPAKNKCKHASDDNTCGVNCSFCMQVFAFTCVSIFSSPLRVSSIVKSFYRVTVEKVYLENPFRPPMFS